jgi:hypothetical protein
VPLPGGPSNKFGQRYEGRWTVNALLRILDEKASWIRLEVPGEDFTEFALRAPPRTEYHQAKRAYAKAGRWSIRTLFTEGVLGEFKRKLDTEADALCIFVSEQDANDLHVLSGDARGALSAQEFLDHFATSETRQKALRELVEGWKVSDEEAFELLRRIRVETASDSILLQMAEGLAEKLVDAEPALVNDVLAQLAVERIHDELYADAIWRYLEGRGLRRRTWAHDPHVHALVESATGDFLSRLRRTAIGGNLIERSEAAEVVSDLRGEARLALVSGEAGTGKSHVVLQAVEALRSEMPVLAFRADGVTPDRDPKRIGADIGLTGSPAVVLAAIADSRPALLVIDQLDATSTASGRRTEFFEAIEKIVLLARSFPEIRVLLACRQFDLENDRRLRSLVNEDEAGRTYPVGRLSRSIVEATLTELGIDSSALGELQLTLLELPLHLSLLAEAASDEDILSFSSPIDLFALFWNVRRDKVEERAGGRSGEFRAVVEKLCDHMSSRQILSAPLELVEDDFPATTEAMASEGVVVQQGGRLSFFHESFFDYAFVRRLIGRGGTLVDLLAEGEQHLFRRPQVRQFLAFERGSDDPNYLLDLEKILEG